MIQKVVVDDGGGHWLDDEGELMTTVWTSEGWLDLPDSYVLLGYLTEEELVEIDPNSDDINLDMKIEYPFEGRYILVNHADFREVFKRRHSNEDLPTRIERGDEV